MKKWCLVNFLFYILFVSSQNQYTNPILAPGTFNGVDVKSLADPFVLKDDDGTYYLYVTGTGFSCFSSKDLVNWKFEKNVFRKNTAKWATNSFWAPEVIKIGVKYYLHYTAAHDDEIKHIGLAVADNPTRPFVDLNDTPFLDLGNKNTIDSHIFTDSNNRVYLYFTSTMPVPGMPEKKGSKVWVVELTTDLSQIISEPKMLISVQQSWEFSSSSMLVNEGTIIMKNNGIYYLMYSANCYCDPKYGIGYATSSSPTGPFTKYSLNPILSNAGLELSISGTGHHSMVRSPDNSEWFCVYHSHVNVTNLNSTNYGIRQINIDRLEFLANGSMRINGPTQTPQPFPLISAISTASSELLRVFPTVVDSHIQLQQEVLNENTRLKVISMYGTIIELPVNSNATVNLSSLPAGCYQLMLVDGNQQFKTRIIKR